MGLANRRHLLALNFKEILRGKPRGADMDSAVRHCHLSSPCPSVPVTQAVCSQVFPKHLSL